VGSLIVASLRESVVTGEVLVMNVTG